MKIGFFGLLTLIFVVAKLGGWVSWSWWIVFTPAIVGASIGALMIVGVFALGLWAEMSKR